jgi:DNA-binding transcriptional LysR family regulator
VLSGLRITTFKIISKIDQLASTGRLDDPRSDAALNGVAPGQNGPYPSVVRKDRIMANEISDLRLFTRIVAAGSLSETARRLNSSLPAVSRSLAALEARLGVRLIDRASRRFNLTAEGSLLYQRATGILTDIDEAEAEASAKAKAPRGRLRVGAPLEIGRRQIAPLIAQFVEQYPEIIVELILTDSIFDVLGDELDIGLQADPPNDGNIISRTLISSRRVVCASPDYLSRNPSPKLPTDLLAHNCIRFVRGHHVIDRWIFKEAGATKEIQVHGNLSTNNSEVMHEWGLLGRGVVVKAHWDIKGDLQNGRLIELLAPYACDDISLYATFPTRSHLPYRVRVFIDFVVAALGFFPLDQS